MFFTRVHSVLSARDVATRVLIATSFCGAFLLFQVQPVISKIILPWFGGSPAVWTASMFFFQAVLLAGYCYAHLLVRFLPLRFQVGLHLGLVILAISLLPIYPSDSCRLLVAHGDPTWSVIKARSEPALDIAYSQYGDSYDTLYHQTCVRGAVVDKRKNCTPTL